VSVPSEMASHAAYGIDELLSAPAPAAEASAGSVEVTPIIVERPQSLVTPQENSAEAEFVISPVQIPSAADFGVSPSFNSDVQEPGASQNEAPASGAAKQSLLERFDAILKDGFSTSRTSGFEATSAEPTPDVPVATEAGLELTVQKFDTESFEI